MSGETFNPVLPGIGIFGTGIVVRVLTPILKRSGFRVVALWGRTPEDAKEVAADLVIPFYTSRFEGIDEVLLRKDVDLVLILCSPNLHSQIAVKALGIGKHVLCSGTPTALGPLEALRMISAAKYYPSLMSIVALTLRFLPLYAKLKHYIEESYVGSVELIEVKIHCGNGGSVASVGQRETYGWACDDHMGGGMLSTLGGSVVDLLAFLTRQRASRVTGCLKTVSRQTDKINGIRRITADDFCTFQMEMDGGAFATVTLNNLVTGGQFLQEVLVVGSKGHLVVRGTSLYGFRSDSLSSAPTANKEELLYHEPPSILDENKCGAMESIKADLPTPYLKGFMRLVEALKDAFKLEEDRLKWKQSPLGNAADFDDALYVECVLDAIRRSNSSRKWLKVQVVSKEPDLDPTISDALRRSTFSLK